MAEAQKDEKRAFVGKRKLSMYVSFIRFSFVVPHQLNLYLTGFKKNNLSGFFFTEFPKF